MTLAPLPIDEHLEKIADALNREHVLVVVAPPGSGKTTRIPPRLLDAGPLLLLQPRRVAARATARRIARERGWEVGGEIGWQIRFERRFTRDSRLLVATEGILTARLQADPLLEGFQTVVIDEFHERSLHVDLAIAFLRQTREARPDLRLVIMSATLDAQRVAGFLGGATLLQIESRSHAVSVSYEPYLALPDAVERCLAAGDGDVLAFLPGAREIEAVRNSLALRNPRVDVLPLHGSLDSDAQDRALTPSERRKIVLATNIAETSLTIENVTSVVDSGLHRVLRYDSTRGIDALVTERISQDSAEQRRGRAGRMAPGRVIRLWDPRQILNEQREAEIRRVDLAPVVLTVIAWGGDPHSFDWFEAPPAEEVEEAMATLERLGAVRGGSLTSTGTTLAALPLHPRLGSILVQCEGSPVAARVCALLAESDLIRPTGETSNCDLLPVLDRLGASSRIERTARLLRAALARRQSITETDDEERLRHAIYRAFVDRLARRRERGSQDFLLANGSAARLARESGIAPDREWIVALQIGTTDGAGARPALIRLASTVEAGWVQPTDSATILEVDRDTLRVRAIERVRHGALVLREEGAALDPTDRSAALAPLIEQRLTAIDNGAETGEGDADAAQLLRRARFARVAIDLGAISARLATSSDPLPLRPIAALDRVQKLQIDQQAPRSIQLPSGRRANIHYDAEGRALVAAKLQELFGLTESPRLGPRDTPITFQLLAPSGRLVQTTDDLRSFWERGYKEVRKELRGRYPKHPWPEDPWIAQATAKTKRRLGTP